MLRAPYKSDISISKHKPTFQLKPSIKGLFALFASRINEFIRKTSISISFSILFHSINDRLIHLNSLLQTWQMLESRLDQLRGDLREDEQALGLLDDALQEGNFSNQMATSVQDVAKLLSKTKTTQVI